MCRTGFMRVRSLVGLIVSKAFFPFLFSKIFAKSFWSRSSAGAPTVAVAVVEPRRYFSLHQEGGFSNKMLHPVARIRNRFVRIFEFSKVCLDLEGTPS